MTAFDRRQRLLSLMRSDPPLRVPMIAQALGVSEGTVRNDLNALAEQRQIIRVRGGGVLRNNAPPHNVPRNAAFATRAGVNEAAKRQIGRRAAVQVVALIDSSKFGKLDLTPSVRMEQVSLLFTDGDLDADWVERLRQANMPFTICT